jgi:4-amino-4-deoxy-L-arabinose transferase-like glycosyltransferase
MFWATATAYKTFGESEFSARLPSFLFSLLATILTYLLARDLRDHRFGLEAVAVLSTMFLFYLYSGYVAVDTALLISVTLSMASFQLAMQAESSSGRRVWGYLFFAGIGLSLLAKGLVGPALIFLPLLVWTVCHRNHGEVLRAFPWITGTLLAAAIALPWHVLCEIRSPGFLNYYFIGEHFRRFTVSNWEGDRYGSPHQAPVGTIWLYLALISLPWSIVLLAAILRSPGRFTKLKSILADPRISFFLFWLLSAPCLFTLSRNVMITYVLPSLPPFAILTVSSLYALKERFRDGETSILFDRRLLTVSAAAVPLLFLVAAYTVIPRLATQRSQRDLVRMFLQLDVDGDAELVYTDTMPHTGDFYTKGRASDIPDESLATVLHELRDLDQDYFAIEDNELEQFPLEGLRLTTEVGRFGKYTLRREFDPHDAAPPQLLEPIPQMNLP